MEKEKVKTKKKPVKKKTVKKTKKETIKKIVEQEIPGLGSDIIKELENALKKKTGRPKKYETVEELEEVIDEYFRSCMKPMLDGRCKPMKDPITGEYMYEQIRPYTMSGLAEALDMDRKTLLNYSRDAEFFHTIERARRKVERYAEESLFNKERCNGSKFSLSNNFGWAEKTETKVDIDKLEDLV